MIQCAWGETPTQAWISRKGLSAPPSFSKYLAALNEKTSSFPESQSVNKNIPSVLFNGMIAPLVPYALTGVISYQGESNEGSEALEYRRLFPRLIRDWRKQWGQGAFPFFFVSLAGFGDTEGALVESITDDKQHARRGWPWLREGAACALSLPNTGMAVATDLGVAEDRLPADKLDVGRRLALLARKRLYGEEVVDLGPRYHSIHIEGAKLRVIFDSLGGGLTLGIPPFPQENSLIKLSTHLKGFAIAGADGKWFTAQGNIEGGSVLLSSDAVPFPRAVRYNWRGFPLGNLYNKEGLPAAPFRSDSFQPDEK
jgi:sialate O-acetylesterase